MKYGSDGKGGLNLFVVCSYVFFTYNTKNSFNGP